MSDVQAAFERIKTSVENALSLANPEHALKEAEHAFMEVLAAAHADLKAAHDALVTRVATLESIATRLPVEAAHDVAGEAEGVLHKIEDFVDHLIHPGGATPEEAQPAVAQNTGSGAAPVDQSAQTARDSASASVGAAGTAPSQSE